ncbi:hypothetical protein [Streptacidiphilus rugosus]|uniref:hypothetical protein n=1 Tax=Streptacidiphilus rugosus TaxID=405783 RepID=UPI0005647CE7|nr:hypothetical protein [Streptacidiphilus rugosus]
MTDPSGRPSPVRGEVAAFHGERYPARAAAGLWPCVELLPAPGVPAPAGLTPRESADGSVGYPAPPEELDAWYAVHWTFRWRGEPFACTDAGETTLSGNYLGDDRQFAAEHLKRRVRGHRGVFPREEVTELTEHQEDLLGPLRVLVRRLAEVDHFRPQAYAVLQGRSYAAAAEADGSGLVALTAAAGNPPAAAVAPEELDAWYLTHWTFRWQNGPFDAVGTVDGRIKGVYTGASWGFVDSWQLTPEEAADGVHQRYTVQVDLDGVTDLEQHRTDLLAGR